MKAAALPVGGKVRADVDGMSKQGRPPAQLERLQDAALAALAAVWLHLDSDDDLPSFFGRLGATVAELTRSRRSAFWRLGPRGTMTLQPAPFGFAGDSPIYDVHLQLGAGGQGVIERVVFGEKVELANGTSPALDALWHASGLRDVKSSIAAAWCSGDRRLGALVVYNSRHGFTGHDLWILRVVGMAAGVVWQHREAEHDLARTSMRLEQAMAARRQLLNNIAAGGDEARRRFASALHDDSLQLLTGAELQLERLRADARSRDGAAQLDKLGLTLHRVEDSMRRLLVDVSPEPLQLPSDFRQAVSEQLESMRIRAGIETHVDTRLPQDIPSPIGAVVLKNVAEALNNVEKHARATRVTLVAEVADGGVRVEVSDDGTGFVSVESPRMPGHIGLVAMRERAEVAGGWCQVESEPGTGTRVEFWIPLSL